MLDTNTLLSIAFSMIACFTNVVDVPPSAVPTRPGDLGRYVIGRPNSPVDLVLTHHSGTQYWIRQGAVHRYSSPDSFFQLQDGTLLPTFVGSTALTSNDVVQIAQKALRRLAKTGDPLGDGPPRVQFATPFQGRQIPFFRVTWPSTNSGTTSTAAEVEVDGRSGRIVALDLWSPCFYDRAFEAEIREMVHLAPRPTPKRPPQDAGPLKPTTNYVNQTIGRWLAFCDKVGMEPGTERSLADVDWDRTFLYYCSGEIIYTNGTRVPPTPFCRTTFHNGAYFDSVQGAVISHYSADAAFSESASVRTNVQWASFEGQPTKRWEELAEALEGRLSTRLGVLKSLFAQTQARQWSRDESRPGHPLKRMKVCWCWVQAQPRADRTVEELRSLLSAEFDLQTGEVKCIEFHFPQFVEPVWRVLSGNTSGPPGTKERVQGANDNGVRGSE